MRHRIEKFIASTLLYLIWEIVDLEIRLKGKIKKYIKI
jgi:hypothetical protein